MKTYNATWKGLDRGHEGAWSPLIWHNVLNAFAKYSPVDLTNAEAPFYADLIRDHPEIQWITNTGDGQSRNFFRDGREPWQATRVVSFNAKLGTGEITAIGNRVVLGELSYSDVLASAAFDYEESGEFPFRILLTALLKVPSGTGLVFDDVVKVMRHYRDGDDIKEVLALPVDALPANCQRRLRAMLMVLEYAGMVIRVNKRYFPGQSHGIIQRNNDELLVKSFDLLSTALRLFEKEREESDKHSKYADLARTWFADYTPQKLKDDFATFQRDLIWSGMVRAQVTKDYAYVDKLADLLDELKKDPRPLAYYLSDEFNAKMNECPGIGIGTIVDMLMKMHPDEYCAYTDMMHSSLKMLGLLPANASTKLNSENYRRAMGLYEEIRQRMIQMGIHLTRGENTDDPDFLTVNSFLWFVKENIDLIKEEVMKKQWKPVNSQAKKKTGSRKLSDAFANDDMLKRLAAALRTKPFAILAGHSGTGKSQLVRRLAYMTCNNELLAKEGEGKTAPGNYCMVQVKPNWHDSTDLLGYYSEMGGRHFVNTPFVEFICKAYAYPDTPFFVCLDEMNLAPVEQYFAEYLSAIESMEAKGDDWLTDPLVEVDKTGEKDADGKEKVDLEIVDQIMKGAASTEAAAWIQAHGLTIPKNLFVVGTVNMDETTCQFSRKVLDRAMTLLMNEVKFGGMAQAKKPSEEELLDDDGIEFFLKGDVRGDVGETESKLLDGINEPLANTAFVVAYRFANEYALYEAAWAKLTGVDLATIEQAKKDELAAKALDDVVLMKLLPRIHGERRVVEGIFKGRKIKGSGDDLPGLKAKVPDGLSANMMDAILARSDEYLTFWP